MTLGGRPFSVYSFLKVSSCIFSWAVERIKSHGPTFAVFVFHTLPDELMLCEVENTGTQDTLLEGPASPKKWQMTGHVRQWISHVDARST